MPNRAPVAVAVWPRHTTHAAQHALNGVFVAGITGRARFHFLRVRRTAFNLGHRSISGGQGLGLRGVVTYYNETEATLYE